MRVLVACEFSGVVRDAFIALNHNAISCDLLPSERPGPHYEGDVLTFLAQHPPYYFDLMIAHPPCTYLAVSGAWHSGYYPLQRRQALDFVRALLEAPVHRIALENPVSIISTRIRKPEQRIQPWMFGHPEVKTTCLWLKNLPLLVPTNIVDGRAQNILNMKPGPNRAKDRSRTYPGIAAAMAEQWGSLQ